MATKELATLAPLQPIGGRSGKASLASEPGTLTRPGIERQPLAPPGLQTFRDMQKVGQARPPSPAMRSYAAAPPSPYRAANAQGSVGATAQNQSPNGYKVDNGMITGSAHNGPQQSFNNGSSSVAYSDRNTSQGNAVLSDEQYHELLDLGETNVRENFVSQVDPTTGETIWTFYPGGQGRSYDEVYREGNYHIDANGRYVNDRGEAIAIGTYGQTGVQNPRAQGYNAPAGRTPWGPNEGQQRLRPNVTVNPTNESRVTPGEMPLGSPRRPETGFERFDGPGVNLAFGGAERTQPTWNGTQPKGPTNPATPPTNTDQWTSNTEHFNDYTYDPGTPINGDWGPVPGSFDPMDFMEEYFRNGGSNANSSVRSRLSQLMDHPSGWDSEMIQRELKRGGEAIDDQFAMREDRLAEEMAARGLSDSSIRGGRYADLNVEQKSAETDLNERVLSDAARGFGQDQLNAFRLALDSDQQGFGNDMRMLAELLGFGQQAFDNDMETQRFMQELQKWQDQLAMFGAGV